MRFFFKANGVEITHYIAAGGLEYQDSEINGSKDGRFMDGELSKTIIAEKDKFSFKCRPLTTAEHAAVKSALRGTYISCQYLSPNTNQPVLKTMVKGADMKSAHLFPRGDTDYWEGLSFSLIER